MLEKKKKKKKKSPYSAVSVNLRKLGDTFHRGTVFAPTQSLHEKEATGMQNTKM